MYEALIERADLELGYREFLALAFEEWKAAKPSRSYATFARDAGFGSKSYFRDIVKGTKSLNPENFLRITKALRMTGSLREYLRLIAIREEARMNIDRLAPEEIAEKIRRTLVRLKASMSEARPFPKINGWFEAYAALGTANQGATLAEIIHRTGLPAAVGAELLQKMVEGGIARHDLVSQRYFPGDPHLLFPSEGKNNFARSAYLEVIRKIADNARRDYASNEKLFFFSCFSVASDQLPGLKSELHETMLRFVDHAENAHGDKVIRLGIGMT